ncbi:MAG: class I SAM-dependent methyltransferase [Flavobacteriaceae bacterium]
MNKALLRPEIQQFIKTFQGNLPDLAFKGSPFKEVSVQELIQQIEGHRKCKEKLPLWHITENIYYPPKVHIEQTSSEVTARYKASLVFGKTLADITGGFGVDCYYFSEKFITVHHYEQNTELSKIAQHNFKILKKEAVSFFSEDGLKGVKNNPYDVIYADPSRRHEAKGKVFFLKDCEPNIIENLEVLLKYGATLLIKTSPMLDISAGLRALSNVSEVHIVAVENEVKELLWLIHKMPPKRNPQIKTVNFQKGVPYFFDFEGNNANKMQYSNPLKYLYEPNAAIMKSGGFSELSEAFNVPKLAEHSHLFTLDSFIEFPGRIFKILEVIPYSKLAMKPFLNFKAHVSTRNFPETVAQLKKKWKISDGGETYLFFTTLENKERVVIKCEKM